MAQELDNTVEGVFFVSLGLLLLEKRTSGWSFSELRSNFELELRFSEWISLLQRWQCGVSGFPYNTWSGVRGNRVKGEDIWVLGNLNHITFCPSLEKRNPWKPFPPLVHSPVALRDQSWHKLGWLLALGTIHETIKNCPYDQRIRTFGLTLMCIYTKLYAFNPKEKVIAFVIVLLSHSTFYFYFADPFYSWLIKYGNV